MNEELKTALIRVLPFLVILIVLFIATKKRKIAVNDLHLKNPSSISHFLLWVIVFFVFILATEFTLFQLGILEVDKWNHSLFASIIRISGAVILAPIAEELIFRGLLLSKLMNKKISVHFAILLQACVFVLLHNFAYQNTLSSNIGIAQGFIDATLFGYARQYTKSLYTPIAMHMTGNLIATLERFIL